MNFLNDRKLGNTSGINVSSSKGVDLVLMDNFFGKLYSIMNDMNSETNKTLNYSNKLNIMDVEKGDTSNRMFEEPTQDIMTHLHLHIHNLESILNKLTISNENFKLVMGE